MLANFNINKTVENISAPLINQFLAIFHTFYQPKVWPIYPMEPLGWEWLSKYTLSIFNILSIVAYLLGRYSLHTYF